MISTLARKVPSIALGITLALLRESAVAVRVHEVALPDDGTGLGEVTHESGSPSDTGHLSVLAAWAPTHSGFLQQVEANRDLEVAGPAAESQGPAVWPKTWKDSLKNPRMVGQGAFGKVYVADIACAPGQSVAVKEQTFKTSADKSAIKTEIKLMKTFSGPDFVSIFDSSEVGRSLNIMMEAASGDLGAVMKKRHASTAVKHQLFMEMLRGVATMHEAGYIHRDLKPANILISGKCGAGPCHAKVADLGLSCSHSGKISRCNGIGGTPMYMAPETLRHAAGAGRYADGVNSKNDVWALGLIFYEMLFGHMPQSIASSSSMRALERNIIGFKIQNDPEYTKMNSDTKELFQKMLEPKPRNRWSAAEALSKAKGMAQQVGAELTQQAAATRLPECWSDTSKGPGLAPPVIPREPAKDRPEHTRPVIPKGPGKNQPAQGRPNQARPVIPNPGKNQPAQGRPDQVRPVILKPGKNQPAQGRPDQVRPVILKPGKNQPAQGRPDQVRPVILKPVIPQEPLQFRPAHGVGGGDEDVDDEGEVIFLTFTNPSTNMKVTMLKNSCGQNGVIKIPPAARKHSHSGLRDGDVIEEIAGVAFSDITESTWNLIKEGAFGAVKNAPLVVKLRRKLKQE